MLWSGLVSWVGAPHRVNLIATLPLGQKCPRSLNPRKAVIIAIIVYFIALRARVDA